MLFDSTFDIGEKVYVSWSQVDAPYVREAKITCISIRYNVISKQELVDMQYGLIYTDLNNNYVNTIAAKWIHKTFNDAKLKLIEATDNMSVSDKVKAKCLKILKSLKANAN